MVVKLTRVVLLFHVQITWTYKSMRHSTAQQWRHLSLSDPAACSLWNNASPIPHGDRRENYDLYIRLSYLAWLPVSTQRTYFWQCGIRSKYRVEIKHASCIVDADASRRNLWSWNKYCLSHRSTVLFQWAVVIVSHGPFCL